MTQTEQNALQTASEARKVQAYQRGYNDRMAGRAKDSGIGATQIEHGAYLQGWHDGGTLQRK